MNKESEIQQTQQKKSQKSRNDYIRISRETKKKILSDIAALNRKNSGRSVTPDQYVTLAVSLVTDTHLQQLKDESLSNKDRLDLKYREYCAEHGRISFDEFLGVLLFDKKDQLNKTELL